MKQECFVRAPSSATTLRYRVFARSDIPAAHALSKAFGWAHRPEDWQFSVDCATGVVAEEGGVVVGTALCWKFGTDRASIGNVIVSPNHHGRGIGRKLVEMLLGELGSREVFLHATQAGRPLYEKLGFTECGSLEQYQGTVVNATPVVLPDGERIRLATPEDFPHLADMASRASGLERRAILCALFKLGDSVVLQRGGEIIGFSVLRRFGRGYVIGPVVAPHSSEDVRAMALISHWLAGQAGEFIRIDVPSGATFGGWLSEQGLNRVDVVPKMVRNAPADATSGLPDRAGRYYAVISQAMF